MTTTNHPNNIRLRELIEASGMSQTEALTIFNKGTFRKYSLSAWKAYLSDPSAARWRKFDDVLCKHAEKVLSIKR